MSSSLVCLCNNSSIIFFYSSFFCFLFLFLYCTSVFGAYSFSNYVSSLYLSCILEFPYFLWRLFIAFKTFLLSLRHASANLVCAGEHVINTAQAAILPVNVPLALKDNSVKLVREHFAKYVFSSTFDFQKKREKKLKSKQTKK